MFNAKAKGALAAFCVALSVAGAAAAGGPPPGDVNLNWNAERQVIEGFGAAGAFNKGGSIWRLPDPATREKMLDLMFSKEKGIGLSLWRNIVGDGGVNYSGWGTDYDGSADTIWPDKAGGFVWDRADWAQKKATFDKYQIWLMREALKRNPDMVFMSSVWSPPHWMKTNNSVMGTDARATANGQPTNAGRVKPENYQDFADYLAEYVLGYQREFGLSIRYISIANEPSLSSAYAHAGWNGNELNTFVRDYLGPTFRAKNVPAKIMMPEHVNFAENALFTTALNDPATAPFIDVIGTHAYGLNFTADAYTATFPTVKNLGKGLWQTEFMSQGAPQDNQYENNLAGDGVKFSKVMSDMLQFAEINAYLSWWAVANNGADGSDLIRLANDGRPQGSAATNFTGTETGEYRVFKRFYTFGQFSRFIRAGYVRLSTDNYRPKQDVRISAYKRPEIYGNVSDPKFVIVAVNQSTDEEVVTVRLDAFPETKALATYRTSDAENMRKLADTRVVFGQLTLRLEPNSVTTFVAQDAPLPELNLANGVFSIYEAEEAKPGRGVLIANLPHENGKALTGIRPGDNVKFANINFADGSAAGDAPLRYTLSMHARVAASAGGEIEARIDSPVGPVVGTLTAPADFAGWAKLSTAINTAQGYAYGHHDLYLVFKGPPDSRFSLDLIRFDNGRIAPAATAELVVNGGGEVTAPLTWVRQGAAPGTVSQNINIPHSGAGAVQIVGRNNAAVGIGQTMTNKLEDRYVYELSAWVRPATADDEINAVLSIARNGMPNLIYPVWSVSARAGEWTQLKTEFSVPVQVSQVSAGGMVLYFTSGTTGDFAIDDVTLKLSPKAAAVDAVSSSDQLSGLQLRVGALGLNGATQNTLLANFAPCANLKVPCSNATAVKVLDDFLADLATLSTGSNPAVKAADAAYLRGVAEEIRATFALIDLIAQAEAVKAGNAEFPLQISRTDDGSDVNKAFPWVYAHELQELDDALALARNASGTSAIEAVDTLRDATANFTAKIKADGTSPYFRLDPGPGRLPVTVAAPTNAWTSRAPLDNRVPANFAGGTFAMVPYPFADSAGQSDVLRINFAHNGTSTFGGITMQSPLSATVSVPTGATIEFDTYYPRSNQGKLMRWRVRNINSDLDSYLRAYEYNNLNPDWVGSYNGETWFRAHHSINASVGNSSNFILELHGETSRPAETATIFVANIKITAPDPNTAPLPNVVNSQNQSVVAPLKSVYNNENGLFMVGAIGTGAVTGTRARHYEIFVDGNNLKAEGTHPRGPNWLRSVTDAALTGATTAPGTAEYSFPTNSYLSIRNSGTPGQYKSHGHVLAWYNQAPAWMRQIVPATLPSGYNGTTNFYGLGNGVTTQVRVDKEMARRVQFNHTMYVMRHFLSTDAKYGSSESRGIIPFNSWDVLNEEIHESRHSELIPTDVNNWRTSLKHTNWLAAMSDDLIGGNITDHYIYLLFKHAHIAAPNARMAAAYKANYASLPAYMKLDGHDVEGSIDAYVSEHPPKLTYNDYDIFTRSKARTVYNMVRALNAAWRTDPLFDGRPLIEDVGIQGHDSVGSTLASNNQYAMALYATLVDQGLLSGISFSEFDLKMPTNAPGGGATAPAVLNIRQSDALGYQYALMYKLFTKFAPYIDHIISWGVSGSGWQGSYVLFDGQSNANGGYYGAMDPDRFILGHSYLDSFFAGENEKLQDGYAIDLGDLGVYRR
jgi:O-glycosyl hydrolase/GH35 family endo-1,4-beta-xylanase